MELRLTRGELLLLDWVFTYPAQPSVVDLDWHIEEWHEFRLRVWDALRGLERSGAQEADLWLDDTEAKVLLTMVPTTFRWGAGDDVGYSLKRKLAGLFLPPPPEAVVEELVEEVRDEGKGEGASEGEAEGGTVAPA